MRMARGMDIRSRLVNLAVNRESRRVDGLVADHYIALFVHEDEVRDGDLAEVLGERVQPEVVRQYRVADGDVACDAFVETCIVRSLVSAHASLSCEMVVS